MIKSTNTKYTQSKDLFKNKYYIEQKNDDLKREINSIVSKVGNNVKDVKINYNKNQITKATITIVVSEEEAKNIKVQSDKVDIKIIIDKTKKTANENDKLKNKDNKVSNPKNDDTLYNESLENNKKHNSNVYSFNRGPNGKIYAISTIKKEEDHYKKITPSFKPINIYKNANKNIDIYKRYNFKNIQVRDKKYSNKFSLFV